MIVYFDTSALLKAYVQENGSNEVIAMMDASENLFGSIVITKVEMASAIQRALRAIGLSSASPNAMIAWQDFLEDWDAFNRIRVSVATVEKASDLAWKYGLRGYDSLHLAAALLWRETLDVRISFASFDRNLWLVSRQAGLDPWPEGLVQS